MLGSIISKFDAEAKSHMERQSLNPFSGSFSRSPSPRLSKDQYGKPLAGSKTEERGQKAKCHILREILDLCNCIHDLGVYNKTHRPHDDSDDEDEVHDDEIIISFGEIFQMYTKINDKVVGLLIAAKKRGYLFFEKEILFQRRDDDVLIALIKPIAEIKAIINRELAAAVSPVPFQSREVSPAVGESSDRDSPKASSSAENGQAQETLDKSKNASKTCNNDKPARKASPVPVKSREVSPAVSENSQRDNSQTSHSANNQQVQELTDKNVATGEANNNDVTPVLDGKTSPIPDQISANIQVSNTQVSNTQVSDILTNDEGKSSNTEGEQIVSNNVVTEKEINQLQDTESQLVSESKKNIPEIIPLSEVQNQVNNEERQIPRLEITFESEPLSEEKDRLNPSIDAPPSEDAPKIEINIEPATPEPLTISRQSPEYELASSEPPSAISDAKEIAEDEQVVTYRPISPCEAASQTPVSNVTDGVEALRLDDGDTAIQTDSPIVTSEVEIQTETVNESQIIDNRIEVPTAKPVISEPQSSSHQDLIDNLASTHLDRSPSPDPCDEEVQQILESHISAVSPIIEPLVLEETFDNETEKSHELDRS